MVVTISPTYSGCPATRVIEADIREAIEQAGIGNVSVKHQLNPPWTTDWITESGKQCLKESGITPPACWASSSWRSSSPPRCSASPPDRPNTDPKNPGHPDRNTRTGRKNPDVEALHRPPAGGADHARLPRGPRHQAARRARLRHDRAGHLGRRRDRHRRHRRRGHQVLRDQRVRQDQVGRHVRQPPPPQPRRARVSNHPDGLPDARAVPADVPRQSRIKYSTIKKFKTAFFY